MTTRQDCTPSTLSDAQPNIRFDPLTAYPLQRPAPARWCVFCDARPCDGTTARCSS